MEESVRTCGYSRCRRILVRHPEEPIKKFIKRKHCNRSCAMLHTHEVKKIGIVAELVHSKPKGLSGHLVIIDDPFTDTSVDESVLNKYHNFMMRGSCR